jgi:hypothetical protein
LADPKIVDSNSATNPQLDDTRHKDPHLERVIALTVNIVHYMFWILFGVELYGVDGFKRWLDVNLRQRAREEVMTLRQLPLFVLVVMHNSFAMAYFLNIIRSRLEKKKRYDTPVCLSECSLLICLR